MFNNLALIKKLNYTPTLMFGFITNYSKHKSQNRNILNMVFLYPCKYVYECHYEQILQWLGYKFSTDFFIQGEDIGFQINEKIFILTRFQFPEGNSLRWDHSYDILSHATNWIQIKGRKKKRKKGIEVWNNHYCREYLVKLIIKEKVHIIHYLHIPCTLLFSVLYFLVSVQTEIDFSNVFSLKNTTEWPQNLLGSHWNICP